MESIGNIFHAFVKRKRVVSVKMNVPIPFHFKITLTVFKIMCRRKFVNIFKESFVSRGVLEGEIAFQYRSIEFFLKSRVFEKTFYFRTEHISAAHFGIIHWLYAKKVTRSEKFFLVFVPDKERKHSSELSKKLFAVFFVTIQKNFRICFRAEFVACFKQLLTKRLIIVNFSVKYNDE